MRKEVEKSSITIEQAHQMLLEEGLEISLKETGLVLDFLRKMAK